MEVPTLRQFKQLLNEDHIFRDYFNTFLSLPIFSRRVKYVAETKSFDIDPRLQPPRNCVVDDDAVTSWLHVHRLPFFWSSPLLYQYTLCLQLTAGDGDAGAVLTAGVEEMGRFQQFLTGTEGEASCRFWLDTQLLLQRLQTRQVQQTELAPFTDQIQRLYLSNGASFCLSGEIRDTLTKKFCRLNLRRRHSRHIQALQEAQGQVVISLKDYWCRMFEGMAGKRKRRVKYPFQSAEAQDVAMVERRNASPGLPTIVKEKRKMECCRQLEKASVKLPRIKRGGRETLPPLTTNTLTGLSSPEMKPLLTPSTVNLFPLSLLPLNHSQLSPAEKSVLPRVNPFLTGSLRADFLAGHPLLRHLSLRQRSHEAANYLLFWWSAELLFTLDEVRRQQWSPGKKINKRGSPYFGCIDELFPIATTPKELVQLFIKRGSPHSIELPPQTREELVQLLPRGLGQSLLVSVQEYAAQKLLLPWREFLAMDIQVFEDHCTAGRLLDREILQSVDDIVECVYGGGSGLEEMWKALRLSEISWFPATASLPSRTCPAELSLSREREGDGSSLLRLSDLAGVSLRQPLTIVSETMKRTFGRSVNTILSVTTPRCAGSKPQDMQRMNKVPGSLKEVLKDCEQLRQFWEFLVGWGGESEVQLLFWLAAEDLASTTPNSRASSVKMKRIVRKFFNNRDTMKALQCPENLISSERGPIHSELLALQAAVGEAMERRWFNRYVASLTVDETQKKEEETGDPEQSQIKKAPICIEHTRNLWMMFAQGVISFRRGLMDQETAEDFKSYLREEVVRGSSNSHKKMVGTKVVYVTKLLNDLSFWAEVERYKDVADAVRAAKKGRSHTPEDDIMVHKKAHAIINCFIDSAVVPRVQINIPSELVHYILDCASQGQISRGLFHEAALNIFSILTLYWRKYLTIQHSRKKAEGVAPTPSHAQPHPPYTIPHNHTRQLPKLHKVATFDLFSADIHSDVGPTLAFSLAEGVHWLHPSHRQQFELAPPTAPPTPSSSQHLRPSRRHTLLGGHASRKLSPHLRHHSGERSQISLQLSSSPGSTSPSPSSTTPTIVQT